MSKEVEEKIFAPSCELHFAADRPLIGVSGQDVEGDAAQIVEGAVAAGLPGSQTRVFASSEEAAKFLADFVAPGDLLLVKGSRGVKMERIVESVLAVHAPELAGTEKVRH